MRPSEVAKRLGCSARHVRTMITSGKIKAKQVKNPFYSERIPIVWEITEREVKRLEKLPVSAQGWPRGKSRKL